MCIRLAARTVDSYGLAKRIIGNQELSSTGSCLAHLCSSHKPVMSDEKCSINVLLLVEPSKTFADPRRTAKIVARFWLSANTVAGLSQSSRCFGGGESGGRSGELGGISSGDLMMPHIANLPNRVAVFSYIQLWLQSKQTMSVAQVDLEFGQKNLVKTNMPCKNRFVVSKPFRSRTRPGGRRTAKQSYTNFLLRRPCIEPCKKAT